LPDTQGLESDPSQFDPLPSHGSAPLSGAARQRLQKVLEHAQRCVEKHDYGYATELLSQCVVEDPGNLIYLQSFLANLQQKYDDNKKGAKFAALKLKSHRSALAKAAGRGDWQRAFQAGCAGLALNPWDIPTLLALAQACEELAAHECQLYYLRWALNVDPQNVQSNRQAALTLQRMGQFDQAIACWLRVEQVQPNDEEALQAISRLSVEKTIKQGGYEELTGQSNEEAPAPSVARFARDADPDALDGNPSSEPPEQRWTKAIEDDPAEVDNYLQLASLYIHQQRLDDAEQLLTRAAQASGGGDLVVRERIEDVQLRRVRHQLAVAEQRHLQQPSEEAAALVGQLRAQANQVELEIYAARSDREPGSARLKYELGLRLKRAGKFKEAIVPLQAARADSKRLAQVLVELGECFQKIEQYKLALAHYEQAIEACQEPESEVRKLALYRAGVLGTGLRELDRAERHLTELAGLDFGFRDVADRLDKISQLRDTG